VVSLRVVSFILIAAVAAAQESRTAAQDRAAESRPGRAEFEAA
jgi:hypothetical protein